MPRGLGTGRLGNMPLGGGEYNLTTLIERPSSFVFRKAHIKRRLTSNGLYEANWQAITELVKKWGSADYAIDDTRLNRFTHSGVNLLVRNDTGRFNDETNTSSLWFGYLTRYRTLVRIQAGYLDEFNTEYPPDPTQGIYILTDEPEISGISNDVNLRCSSLRVIFDELRADRLPGLNATFTASQIVTRIRDHTDGAGVAIFQQFITSGAWTIQTTTNNYIPATTGSNNSLDQLSVWGLMEKLAEAEGFVLLLNRTGGIEFRNRSSRTTTAAFAFRGQGFHPQTVIKLAKETEAVNKLYTYVRYKYLAPDTSTSFVTAGTTTSVNPTNTSWIYGQRVYEFENTFAQNTATAQTIADNFFTNFGSIRKEVEFDAKMVPTLEALDRITLSYRSYDIGFSSLWDVMIWNTGTWAREGQNFDYEGEPYNVLSRRLNLDNFSMTIRAREI